MATVLIVDDSRFMRMMLRKILSSDPEIMILGDAADGPTALEEVKKKSPEVVTLDLQMPGMDGLTALANIMKEKPATRVVVISSSTKEGAEASAEALKRGAVGMVQKPSGTASADIDKMKVDLIRAIKDAAKAKLYREAKTSDEITKSVQLKQDSADPAKKIVVICASTGGPQEIRRLATMLRKNMPAAIVIMQQMHSKFTKILMKDMPAKLNETTGLTVSIANDGDVLRNGQVTFAPEENDIVVKREEECLVLRKQPVTGGGGASFDVMLKSVAETCGKDGIGVLLTGDTTDGVAGLAALKAVGAVTIVQDPTCGCASPHMPKEAIKCAVVDYVLTIEDIPAKILELLERGGTSG